MPRLSSTGNGSITTEAKCKEFAAALKTTYTGKTRCAGESCAPLGCYRFEKDGKLYWNDDQSGTCTTERACVESGLLSQHAAVCCLSTCQGRVQSFTGSCPPPLRDGEGIIDPHQLALCFARLSRSWRLFRR